MTWLNTMAPLAQVLQEFSAHWICFLQYESAPLVRHPNALDESVGLGIATLHPQSFTLPFSQNQNYTWVRCVFAANPKVICRELSAKSFFDNPLIQRGEPTAYLIPSYGLSQFAQSQQDPFLAFGFSDVLEFSGALTSEGPEILFRGEAFQKFFSDKQNQEKDRSADISSSKSEPLANHSAASEWQASESPTSIVRMLEKLQHAMQRGECYLANASTRLLGPQRNSTEIGLADFVGEWIHEPSRHGVFVSCGEENPLICCFSPERFVRRSGAFIQAEPIKGTVRWGRATLHDDAQKLWKSQKEMCEQTMVTDLLRNDLNLVCAPGSVWVNSPYEIRAAGELLQMQSVVQGVLQDQFIPNGEILRRMSPAGSVTGTPKWTVGEQINHVECTPRGYYTGVFALADSSDSFESTILIRGFFASPSALPGSSSSQINSRWTAGVGAGITTLSDLTAESFEFDLKWNSFSTRWARLVSGAFQEKNVQMSIGECGDSCDNGDSVNKWLEDFFRSGQADAIGSKTNGKFSDDVKKRIFATESSVGARVDLSSAAQLEGDLLSRYLLFVDHLDSFSENLIAALCSRGISVARIVSAPARNWVEGGEHEQRVDGKLAECLKARLAFGGFAGLVLSPGPGLPEDYPFSQALLTASSAQTPVLGVCLGHQILLSQSGCQLTLVSEAPVHGRREELVAEEDSRWLSRTRFAGVSAFYNSWAVSRTELAGKTSQWRTCSVVGDTLGLCEHISYPRIGVQFHPESFATRPGARLLDAFVALLHSRKIA